MACPSLRPSLPMGRTPGIASPYVRNVAARTRRTTTVRGVSNDWRRVQAIAAGGSHQQAAIGRIGLDLLPQTVNMRLQRVGGDAGIVAPDLVEQNLARYDL